jgi:hypothetical protein
MEKYRKLLNEAIQFYWSKCLDQNKRQGAADGRKDAGNRSAVTGGAHLFQELIMKVMQDNGLPETEIHSRQTTLPGYFRPTKEWDLLVVRNNALVATIEFKSQAGPSFGNNFNNRVEEALGSATDLWTAFREGAFRISQRPWLGYFLLLESEPHSLSPVRLQEPHFEVFPEFKNTSYRDRYRVLCERLIRERLYDAACFITSEKSAGIRDGAFEEPDPELGFDPFIRSLIGKIASLE